MTILVSNTLGTALGDFVATTTGLGFEGAAFVFVGLIALITVTYLVTEISPSLLFWSAYILTRPLGATLGDTLTKAHGKSGFALDRMTASLTIALLMVVGIMLTARKAKTIFQHVRSQRNAIR